MHMHVFSLLKELWLSDKLQKNSMSKHLREKVLSVQGCVTVQYRFGVLSVTWIGFLQQ